MKHFANCHDGKVGKQFKCEYCNCKMDTKAEMSKHKISVHGGKKPECTECKMSFFHEKSLIDHLKKVPLDSL